MCLFLAFENSAATALIAASMPPIPKPVSTRHADSTERLEAVVTMNMPAPSRRAGEHQRPAADLVGDAPEHDRADRHADELGDEDEA